VIALAIATLAASPVISILIYSAGRRRGFKEGARAAGELFRGVRVLDASRGSHPTSGESWTAVAVAP
jgi:hypothetical protein